MESKYEILKELQEMGNEKASFFDHKMKGFKHENGGDESNSYVVDLESLSNVVVDHELNNLPITSSNSGITLQRSLSRKVPQRGPERKIIIERDTLEFDTSSPRAAQVSSTQEQKSLSSPTLSMGSQDSSAGTQLPQHQITIKTGSMNTVTDSRLGRRPSMNRSLPSWFASPKRILLFFATLSSMGTILLIYFTLSMSKRNDKGGLDWQ